MVVARDHGRISSCRKKGGRYSGPWLVITGRETRRLCAVPTRGIREKQRVSKDRVDNVIASETRPQRKTNF